MIAPQIRIALIASGLQTFGALACAVGMPQSTLSQKLHGYLPITTAERERIAEALRSTPDELWPPVDTDLGVSA